MRGCGAGAAVLMRVRARQSRRRHSQSVHARRVVAGSLTDGGDEEGDAEGDRGEDDCGGSVTIAGTRIISWCSNVVASTTCSRDVCCCPDQRVKSLSI